MPLRGFAYLLYQQQEPCGWGGLKCVTFHTLSGGLSWQQQEPSSSSAPAQFVERGVSFSLFCLWILCQVCVCVWLSGCQMFCGNYCTRRPSSVHTRLFVFATVTCAGCIEETPKVRGWGDSSVSLSTFVIARSQSRSQQHGSQSRLSLVMQRMLR